MEHFEIKNLSFAYPTKPDKKVLDGIDLSIEHGQYITICGRSGSGKTTLLRHLKSVLTPNGNVSGDILFEGQKLYETDLREQSSKIAYVMQNPDNQIVTDKVWHELAFGLESLGVDQKTIRLRVAEMASYFGIQTWFHMDVSKLSGGQKQLLNLASIMAMQPSVLILDEPTSQLDPIAASDFLNTVRKINLELGTTIIITEHRLEDIFHASDRVVVLEEGRIIADDAPKKVGEFLKNANSDMFAALPTPMQIYYGIKDKLDTDKFAANEAVHDCPLTVREGRQWLSEVFGEKSKGRDIETSGNQKTNLMGRKSLSCTEQEDAAIGVPAVSVKEAWYRYNKDSEDVLKGVSFDVHKGRLFALVGGNGTGKSTTLKAIADICRPYRGQILLNGKRLSKYNNVELFKGMLAMLPQDPQSLFVKKTVREDLSEMLRSDDISRIDDVASECEIMHLMDNHPYDLSGGEQQRVALAKVLLTDPQILLLDEPTKGIDNFFKLKFAEILKRLKERGVTVIMVSHDVEFCARFADTVSMFFDGGVVTTTSPRKFFSQNSFYTTAANRMSRHIFDNAVTNEDVIELCRENL